MAFAVPGPEDRRGLLDYAHLSPNAYPARCRSTRRCRRAAWTTPRRRLRQLPDLQRSARARPRPPDSGNCLPATHRLTGALDPLASSPCRRQSGRRRRTGRCRHRRPTWGWPDRRRTGPAIAGGGGTSGSGGSGTGGPGRARARRRPAVARHQRNNAAATPDGRAHPWQRFVAGRLGPAGAADHRRGGGLLVPLVRIAGQPGHPVRVLTGRWGGRALAKLRGAADGRPTRVGRNV